MFKPSVSMGLSAHRGYEYRIAGLPRVGDRVISSLKSIPSDRVGIVRGIKVLMEVEYELSFRSKSEVIVTCPEYLSPAPETDPRVLKMAEAMMKANDKRCEKGSPEMDDEWFLDIARAAHDALKGD